MSSNVLDWRAVRGKAPGDNDLRDAPTGPRNELTTGAPGHAMDSDDARKTLRQLLQWYFYERDRQSANRLEMAVDHDFYDNLQWDQDDAAVLAERHQMPLVFNEVAPMCDWIIGTERRNRVDWKVLPRAEDDVKSADVKTKVLKFVSDINGVPFARSRAFADAVKGGVGWLDDGVRDDPTQDILYSRYEDWRCVLWDSSAMELDLSDARFIFRWRWVDEDVATLMFPGRADRVRSSVEDWSQHANPLADEDTWSTPHDPSGQQTRGGTLHGLASGFADGSQRRRIKLIECQYKAPVATKVVMAGPFKGSIFNPRDHVMAQALGQHGGSIIDKIMMRVHMAVFTESDMLAMGPSIYRHNRFSLTPIWCYRRSRDRLPYGAIRRVRDIQKDLNKRASKAHWLLSTNQIIAEKGAVDDWDIAREEAQMPDGVIITNSGKEFNIRRDTDQATGQIQLMAMDAQSIQKSAGVNQENLGRQTNAVSGEAIKARQLQGAVGTTEPFDNLRLAVQCQGVKQLSLVEQWYTEEKVIRLTGERGALDWVRINQPEVQADGSVRYLNDISASLADFIVSEQDYAGTMRQVLFDSLNQLAQRLPPEISMRLLTTALEFSDLPNKDEIAAQIRQMTGERDPNKEMTPEERQQADQQAQAQAEAMQMQQAMAMGALEEQRAKVREINARADELEAKAEALRMGAEGGDGGQSLQHQMQMERDIAQVREKAAAEIDTLSQALAKAQAQAADSTMRVNREADSKVELARIEQDTAVQVAEIQNASDAALDRIVKRVEDLAGKIGEVAKVAAEKPAPPPPAPAPPPAAPPAAAPPPAVAVPAQPEALPPGKRTFRAKKNAAGDVVGGTIVREDGTSETVTVRRDADGALDAVEIKPEKRTEK